MHIYGMFWLGSVSQCFNTDGVYIHQMQKKSSFFNAAVKHSFCIALLNLINLRKCLHAAHWGQIAGIGKCGGSLFA